MALPEWILLRGTPLFIKGRETQDRGERCAAGQFSGFSSLGLPRAQQNERSALCLLALLNLTPRKKWKMAETPLIGITPIMDWAREHYQKEYAPNTRETVRRQTMHQFVDAGIALYSEIAWETEVWVAEAPSHLIHFNGERFMGPHTAP